MKTSDLKRISDALSILSVVKLPEEVLSGNNAEDFSIAVKMVADKFAEDRSARFIVRSKIGAPRHLLDVRDMPDRHLDKDYIEELATCNFVKEHRNLIIWGSPGTGKTWMGKMIATYACEQARRTKWVSFPALCEELARLANDLDGQTLTSRLGYYARFELLCIDEFPNVSSMDEMLVQRFFDVVCDGNASVMICTQCDPEKINEVFPTRGIGESIRGRLLQNSKRLRMTGPDLRLYTGETTE